MLSGYVDEISRGSTRRSFRFGVRAASMLYTEATYCLYKTYLTSSSTYTATVHGPIVDKRRCATVDRRACKRPFGGERQVIAVIGPAPQSELEGSSPAKVGLAIRCDNDIVVLAANR